MAWRVKESRMPDETKKSIHRASLLLMGSILISRVIGFFREWVLSQTVGATSTTDVYYASFTIPDFINYLMAAGALSISFIPILNEYRARDDEETGKKVFRAIATWSGTLLFVFLVLSMIFARHLAYWVAPGFSPDQLDLLTTLLRIILPAQFFFYWGGLAVSVQQTYGRFFLPAIAPIIYNVGIISFGLLMYRSHGVLGFSIGVTVGCFFSHGILQWIGIRKLGFTALPSFALDDEIKRAMKKYLWLTLPISLGFSIVVADEWISKYFASEMETRAVSWLSYARTQMRIPVAIIGQAAGIASFPFLSRLWASAKYDDYMNGLLREFAKIWILGPLAVTLLYTHALPITDFIYGGGKFTQEDLFATSDTLRMFAFGVFFWILQIPLSRGFYAAQKTWLPSMVGTVLCFLLIPVYAHLGRLYSYMGLAMAGSIGVGLYCVVLAVLLWRHLRKFAPQFNFAPYLKFFFAWAGVCVVFVGIAIALNELPLYQQTRLSALAHVLAGGGVIGGLGLVASRLLTKRLLGETLF